jgi:hypothetical protein
MTAQELAARILAEIATGELDPDAIVIRPVCMCDEDVGYIEAHYLDQVVRRFEAYHIESESGHSGRVYRYGAVPLGDGAARTLKLG